MLEAYNQKKQLNDLSKSILDMDPENRQNQILSKVLSSGLPLEQQVPIFKLLSLEPDPFRQQQQERLSKDSVLNRYSKRIGEIDSQLKSTFGEEAEQLKAQRKKLQDERDKLLGFQALELQDQDDSTSLAKPVAPTKRKIKFDSANPQHIKARDQMLKKYGGEREKAGKALSSTFEL